MCTVSWIAAPGCLDIFFSRDERHQRGVARAPAPRMSRGVRYLAPEDADHGGTWLLANETGLCISLLNGEAGPDSLSPVDRAISRGLLILQLSHCRHENLANTFALLALECYHPFTLVALAPDREPLGFAWDGARCRRLTFDPRLPMLTSSSWRSADVRVSREDELRSALRSAALSPTVLEAFHRSHRPEPGPMSVCMHRADASTVSLSRVRVNAREVEFRYASGPACRRAPMTTARLPRRFGRPIDPRQKPSSPSMPPHITASAGGRCGQMSRIA